MTGAGQMAEPQHNVADNIFSAAACAVENYCKNPDARCPDKVRQTYRIIEDALAKYKPGEIALSFNGGKDCHVMLIILMAVCWKNNHKTQEFPAVYVRADDAFPQVDNFVSECARLYQLQVHTVAKSMKAALQEYLDHHLKVKAIFVGIRRQDPYGQNLDFFQKTDHGWPDFERVHPVLEWDYGDVWDFLRRENIAYCGLYDLGYTSLGGVNSTVPNPELKNPDGTYRSAYMLQDYSKERVGRNVN